MFLACPSASYLFVVPSFVLLYLHFTIRVILTERKCHFIYREMQQKVIQRIRRTPHPHLEHHDNQLSDTELQMSLVNYMQCEGKKTHPETTYECKFKDQKLCDLFIFNSHYTERANSLNRLFELNRIEMNYLQLSTRAQYNTFLCCLNSLCVLRMMDAPNDFISHFGAKCSSRSSMGCYNLSPIMC